MGALRGEPGVVSQDIVRIQPVVWDEGVDRDIDTPQWVANGRPIEVISQKIGSAASFREGKPDQTLSYHLYALHTPGRTFPIGEKDRIWHPEASDRNPDGTPNYATAMEVDSVVLRNRERRAIIEAGRTY